MSVASRTRRERSYGMLYTIAASFSWPGRSSSPAVIEISRREHSAAYSSAGTSAPLPAGTTAGAVPTQSRLMSWNWMKRWLADHVSKPSSTAEERLAVDQVEHPLDVKRGSSVAQKSPCVAYASPPPS